MTTHGTSSRKTLNLIRRTLGVMRPERKEKPMKSNWKAIPGRIHSLVRWLFRCRHKWEDNRWINGVCVEQRCIGCNGHQHVTAHGWEPGRYRGAVIRVQSRNYGKAAALATPCGPYCTPDDHLRYASRGRCALCGRSFCPPNSPALPPTVGSGEGSNETKP